MKIVQLFEGHKCFRTIQTELNVDSEYIEAVLAMKYERMKDAGIRKIGQLSGTITDTETGSTNKYYFEYGKFNDMVEAI